MNILHSQCPQMAELYGLLLVKQRILSDISSQVTYKHGNELQVHRVETLPHKLRKKYLLTYEFVQAVKARTPKVTNSALITR